MHLAAHSVIVLALALAVAPRITGAEPAEPLFRDLAPGLWLTRSSEVPADQARAIGKKLGGNLSRLTNSILQVHGRALQVNVITAADETQAAAVHATLSKMKPAPYCVRKGVTVVEYVGPETDAALAVKTSWELGLLEKPSGIRYRVVAELAAVEEADYMACNPLFNLFLALPRDANAAQEIGILARRFTFGRSLSLRSPALGREPAPVRFQPAAARSADNGVETTYSFDSLPDRAGVPYATVTMEMTVGDTGLLPCTASPAPALTAATPHWPVNDPAIRTLAQTITEGKSGNEAKAAAILAWLAPGRNLTYAGQTGSRWGVGKVLAQRFGHCWDFSDCFVTLARASGVPSRQTAGWMYGGSGHVWAEYYREGAGWQQVDPTGGGRLRCGIYHIAYFVTESGRMPILYVSLPAIEGTPVR
jgi:hypothetical protein